MALDEGILAGIAGRAVFVIDESEAVTYQWESDGVRELPDMDAIGEALAGL